MSKLMEFTCLWCDGCGTENIVGDPCPACDGSGKEYEYLVHDGMACPEHGIYQGSQWDECPYCTTEDNDPADLPECIECRQAYGQHHRSCPSNSR